MTAPFAAVESYQGTGGWSDGRLGLAYDLLDAVMRDHHPETDAHHHAKIARDAAEDADMAVEKAS